MTTEKTVKTILEEKGFVVTNKNQKLKDDIGIDSLDLIELIIELEKELNIDLGVDFEDRIGNMTIEELVSEIEKLKKA